MTDAQHTASVVEHNTRKGVRVSPVEGRGRAVMEADDSFAYPLGKQDGAVEGGHAARGGDDALGVRKDGGCGKCEEDMLANKVGFCAHQGDGQFVVESGMITHPASVRSCEDEEASLPENVGFGMGRGERVAGNNEDVLPQDDGCSQNEDIFLPQHVGVEVEEGDSEDAERVAENDEDSRPQEFLIGEDEKNYVPVNVGIGVEAGEDAERVAENHEDSRPQEFWIGDDEKNYVPENVDTGVDEASRVTECHEDTFHEDVRVREDDEIFLPDQVGFGEETESLIGDEGDLRTEQEVSFRKEQALLGDIGVGQADECVPEYVDIGVEEAARVTECREDAFPEDVGFSEDDEIFLPVQVGFGEETGSLTGDGVDLRTDQEVCDRREQALLGDIGVGQADDCVSEYVGLGRAKGDGDRLAKNAARQGPAHLGADKDETGAVLEEVLTEEEESPRHETIFVTTPHFGIEEEIEDNGVPENDDPAFPDGVRWRDDEEDDGNAIRLSGEDTDDFGKMTCAIDEGQNIRENNQNAAVKQQHTWGKELGSENTEGAESVWQPQVCDEEVGRREDIGFDASWGDDCEVDALLDAGLVDDAGNADGEVVQCARAEKLEKEADDARESPGELCKGVGLYEDVTQGCAQNGLREDGEKKCVSPATHDHVMDVRGKASDTLLQLEQQIAHLRETLCVHKRERDAARTPTKYNGAALPHGTEGTRATRTIDASAVVPATTAPVATRLRVPRTRTFVRGAAEKGWSTGRRDGSEECMMADAEAWVRELMTAEYGRAERDHVEREIRAEAWMTGETSADRCVNLPVENGSDSDRVGRLSSLTVDLLDTEIFALHERLVATNGWRTALEKHVRLLMAERWVAKKPHPVMCVRCPQLDREILRLMRRATGNVGYHPLVPTNHNSDDTDDFTGSRVQEASPTTCRSTNVEQNNTDDAYGHSIIRRCSDDFTRAGTQESPLTMRDEEIDDETNNVDDAYCRSITSRCSDDSSGAETPLTMRDCDINDDEKINPMPAHVNSRGTNSLFRACTPEHTPTTCDLVASVSSAKATEFTRACAPNAPLNDEGDIASADTTRDTPLLRSATNISVIPGSTPCDPHRVDGKLPRSRLVPPRTWLYRQPSASLRAAVKKTSLPTTPHTLSVKKNECIHVVADSGVVRKKAPTPAPSTTDGCTHACAHDTPLKKSINASTNSIHDTPLSHQTPIVSDSALRNNVPRSKLLPRQTWLNHRAPASQCAAAKKTLLLQTPFLSMTKHKSTEESRVVEMMGPVTPILPSSTDGSTNVVVEKASSSTLATMSTTGRLISTSIGRSRLPRSPIEARMLFQDVRYVRMVENASKCPASPPTRRASVFPLIEQERELLVEEEPRAVALPNIDIALVLNPTNFRVRLGNDARTKKLTQKSDTVGVRLGRDAATIKGSDARQDGAVGRNKVLNLGAPMGTCKSGVPSLPQCKMRNHECEHGVVVGGTTRRVEEAQRVRSGDSPVRRTISVLCKIESKLCPPRIFFGRQSARQPPRARTQISTH